MKLIKPSVELYGEVPTDYDSALKFIEMAGRTCYKSEDKITEDSAKSFVKRLIKAGHLAMVEHSNFVVKRDISEVPEDILDTVDKMIGKYLNYVIKGTTIYVGGNLTAWAQLQQKDTHDRPLFIPFRMEYGRLFGLRIPRTAHTWKACQHSEIPQELHRYSAKFICDRGVSHELVRHRPCSFAQESTRYVNYGSMNMEFIEPTGFDDWPMDAKTYFDNLCGYAEYIYEILLSEGLKPQQARAILPNALKTEIVVTADAAEWAHIRKLRTHPSAHPDMVRVMNMIPF